MEIKTKNRAILIIFILVLVVFALIITFNLNYFNNLVNLYVDKYGLIAILVLSFFADLVDQPIGPEVPASIGVIFGLNIVPVLLFSVIGSYLSSSVNFYVGKSYLSKKFEGSWEKKANKKHYKIFKKYGGLALALAAISPLPWVTFCWLSGIFKMKLKGFVVYGLIPRFLRIFTIVMAVKYLQVFFM